MDETKSFSYRLTVGVRHDAFYNNVTIGIPLSVNLFDVEIAAKIREMFENISTNFCPHYGCVSNSRLSRNYGKLIDQGTPTTIHWINYWSNDIVSKIGMHRIKRALHKNMITSYPLMGGSIIQIKETAIDVDNSLDLKLHRDMEMKLLC